MVAFSSSSFITGARQSFVAAAVICCIVFCLPTTTKGLPMKDVVGQAMMMAKMGQQQQQQHREKRAVTKTDCAQPGNLETMFQQINSGVNRTQFLQTLVDNKAITIPDGEEPVEIDADPNETKTCPASITTDSSAPLAHRSLCPYYFMVRNMPEGYYPPTLKTATCKCQRCLEFSAYGCEAVKTPIAVLKPVGCFQGLQKYQEEIIEIKTGCACAFTGSVQTTPAPTTTTTAAWGVQ